MRGALICDFATAILSLAARAWTNQCRDERGGDCPAR